MIHKIKDVNEYFRKEKVVKPDNKVLVIIIPGSKPKNIKLPILGNIIDIVYSELSADPTTDNPWLLELFREIEKKTCYEASVFRWNEGITETFGIKPSSDNFVDYLKKVETEYDDIIIYGKSLGAIVAERALQKYNCKKVKLLIYNSVPGICSKTLPKHIQAVYIKSTKDTFLKLTNILLSLYKIIGKKPGYTFVSDSLTHVMWNDKNVTVTLENNQEKKLFDFYLDIFKSF